MCILFCLHGFKRKNEQNKIKMENEKKKSVTKTKRYEAEKQNSNEICFYLSIYISQINVIVNGFYLIFVPHFQFYQNRVENSP